MVLYYISNMLDMCSFSFNTALQGSSSRWSASRIRAEADDKFDAIKAAREGLPVYFTGEVGYKGYHFSLLCNS